MLSSRCLSRSHSLTRDNLWSLLRQGKISRPSKSTARCLASHSNQRGMPSQDVTPSPAVDQPRRITEPEYAGAIVHGRSVFPAYHLPRTHNIPVATLHFRAHFPHLLDQFTFFAQHVATALGIPTSGTVMLPTQRRLWTVMKGPFAHKSAQENFERKVHKRAIKAWDADGEVVEKWIAYLRRHQLTGVGVKSIVWSRAEVGFGREHDHSLLVDAEARSTKHQVTELGKQIVQKELRDVDASPSSDRSIPQPSRSE